MKFPILIITLMCALVTVPYLFATDAIFDVHVITLNDCDQEVLTTGFYQTQVTYVIWFAVISVVALSIPFMNPKLNNIYKSICFFLSGWYVAGLFYEVMGIFISGFVMEMDDYRLYVKFLLAFVLLITGLQLHEIWKSNTLKN